LKQFPNPESQIQILYDFEAYVDEPH
jgi:hypothetical protein